MTTLTIEIPDKDRDLLEQLAQRLNGKVIKVVEDNAKRNSLTKKAIADADRAKPKRSQILICSSKACRFISRSGKLLLK